jgi:Protein of unknown function (DUF2804)
MPLQKRWRWLGAFGEDAMACVAWAQVGPARVSWWAVWDGRALREGYRRSWRGLAVTRAGARVDGVLSLRVVEADRAIEARTSAAWTRKTPVRVTGSVLGRELSCSGLLDESEGRHPRRVSWLWSAGAGMAASGERVAWNLCDGLGLDEQYVWVGGEPHAVALPRFDGLAGVGDLRFEAQATRARRESLVLIASDYEQPFGTFAGALPVAGELRAGRGVMERHEARW